MTRQRRILPALAVILLTGLGLGAQEAMKSDLRFEAVSIRPATGGGPPISGTTIKGNRLRGTNVTLLGLIRSAYFDGTLVSAEQFVGGPDWIRTERYEIDAVAQGRPTRTEFDRMLRSLLADRFKLAVRRGQRELPAFVMTIAREDGRLGPSITPVDFDCTASRAAFERLESMPRPDNRPPVCSTLSVSGPTGTRISGHAMDTAGIARTFVGYLGGPVVDRTGLKGVFDFEIQFVQEIPGGAGTLGDSVTLTTALREQLGLQVARRSTSVDVLVIESAERPTPN